MCLITREIWFHPNSPTDKNLLSMFYFSAVNMRTTEAQLVVVKYTEEELKHWKLLRIRLDESFTSTIWLLLLNSAWTSNELLNVSNVPEHSSPSVNASDISEWLALYLMSPLPSQSGKAAFVQQEWSRTRTLSLPGPAHPTHPPISSSRPSVQRQSFVFMAPL